MKLTLVRALPVFAITALVMFADDGLRGPVSGLIVDQESGTIRPIIGVPGSAYASQAAVQGVDSATAAPDGRNALVSKDGTLYLVRRLDGPLPVWRMIRDSASKVERATFSADTSALVIHDTGHNRLELWNHLNDQPRLRAEVDLGDIRGRLVSMAAGKDADFVFATFQETETTASLYLLKPNEMPRQLYTLERAGNLLLRDDALWFSDRALNNVYKLTEWNLAFNLATVASAAHGVSDPVGIAISTDGKTLFIANGEARQLIAVDVARQTVKAALALDFHPTQLERSGGVFLLASGIPGAQPAQVLDADRLQVYFVPVSLAPVAEPAADSSILE